MKHSITGEGFGIRHRPVRMDDAAFLVWLRNLDHAKGKVGDSAMDVASQEQWLHAYFAREGDYYFVIEAACGIRVGAWGIYDVTDDSAEIGRWIVRPDAPASVSGIIPGLDIAFGVLGLKRLRTKVVSTNHRVIKMDRRVGFHNEYIEHSAQIIGGNAVDLVCMTMDAEQWPVTRERLLPLALAMEPQICKWGQEAAMAPELFR